MAGGPLVLLRRRDLIVLLLQGVFVQVGGRHGAQRRALAAHREAARRRHAALRGRDVLSAEGSRGEGAEEEEGR